MISVWSISVRLSPWARGYLFESLQNSFDAYNEIDTARSSVEALIGAFASKQRLDAFCGRHTVSLGGRNSAY